MRKIKMNEIADFIDGYVVMRSMRDSGGKLKLKFSKIRNQIVVRDIGRDFYTIEKVIRFGKYFLPKEKIQFKVTLNRAWNLYAYGDLIENIKSQYNYKKVNGGHVFEFENQQEFFDFFSKHMYIPERENGMSY